MTGVGDHNLVTDATCKRSKISAVIISWCFKRAAINEAENGPEPVIMAEELKQKRQSWKGKTAQRDLSKATEAQWRRAFPSLKAAWLRPEKEDANKWEREIS